MKSQIRKITLVYLSALTLIFSFAFTSHAQPYSSLEGVDSVKTVFDIRVKNTRALAAHLDLIVDMFNDPYLTTIQKQSDFVVIIMGTSVNFISGKRDGYSSEELKDLEFIEWIIPRMKKLGIRLEICMFAAKQHKVDPASIPDEIVQVPNGWISSIGYQSRGYTLIPDF